MRSAARMRSSAAVSVRTRHAIVPSARVSASRCAETSTGISDSDEKRATSVSPRARENTPNPTRMSPAHASEPENDPHSSHVPRVVT